MNKILLIDVGSSRIKAWSYATKISWQKLAERKRSLQLITDELSLWQWIEQNPKAEIWVACVHSQRNYWEKWFKCKQLKVSWVIPKPIGPLKYIDYQIEHLGVDRYLLALGASGASCLLASRILLVDCGSAMSVDILERQKNGWRYRGGQICPGVQSLTYASWQVLKRDPEALPLRQVVPNEPQNTTKRALAAGILACLVGAIKEQQLESGAEAEEILVLTGGEANLLRAHLPQARYLPCLLFAGMLAYVQYTKMVVNENKNK